MLVAVRASKNFMTLVGRKTLHSITKSLAVSNNIFAVSINKLTLSIIVWLVI